MAAQNGTLVLVGLQTKRTYSVDCYLPDAAATYWTFNMAGAAASTSPNTLKLPEDCQFYDFSLATSPTATNATLYADNAVINGATIRYANQLTSLPNRQKLNVVLKQGVQIQFLQAA